MIEAHGGLEKWRSAPTVSFEDTLQPPEGPPLSSRVSVEQESRRAYLDFPEMGARIAWDGEKAWSENWQGPFPPRFFALLSYYFLNLPWLAADPGVNLDEPGTGSLWDDPTEYITVRMTFEPGVGDTPGRLLHSVYRPQQLIWCDLSSPGVRIHTLGFPRPYRYDGREAQGEAATTVNHTDIRGLVAA